MKDSLKGFQVIKEDEIHCEKCDALLINIVLMEKNTSRLARGERPLKSKYQVICFKCKHTTSVNDLYTGTTSVGTFRDDIDINIVETEYDRQSGIVSNLIETVSRS